MTAVQTPSTPEAGREAPAARTPDAAAARAFQQLLGAGPESPPAAPPSAPASFHRPFPQDGPPEPTFAAAVPAPGEPTASAVPASPSTAPAAAQEVCDLVTRLVETLYAPHPGTAAGDGAVLIRLAADVLPATELLLARDARGWRLEARTADADSRRLLAGAAAELEARFGARGLGAIRLEALAPGDEPG